jgi:two-component system, cell cycle response regulator
VKRVRNLARLKMLTDEMLMHANAEEQMGLAVALVVPFDQVARRGKRLVLEDHDRSYELILDALKDDPTPTRQLVLCCNSRMAISIYDHQPQLGACG